MKLNWTKNIKQKNQALSSSLASVYCRKKKLIILGTILFCIVFVFLFLYNPAKTFYIELRQHDKLQYQCELLKKNNADLSNSIEALQTEDGIKQKAIDTLGLIQEGESLGYTSVESAIEARDNSSSSTSSKVSYKSIKAPQTWYSPFCNWLFNVTE